MMRTTMYIMRNLNKKPTPVQQRKLDEMVNRMDEMLKKHEEMKKAHHGGQDKN